jgi:DGQHR domain-containing protein
MTVADIDLPCLEVTQGDRELILTSMSAGVLTRIAYVAVRGKDDEAGAVQRVLNTRRISSIKTFTLEGGDYPGAIVLNWTSEQNAIERANGRIRFRDDPRSAQVIDGQHRVAGIAAAIEEKAAIADLEIPVAIYVGLSTRECADSGHLSVD